MINNGESMPENQNFENLDTWKKGMELCLFCYELTKKFPKEEKYGLTNQVQRASASAPSNIAEGYSRRTFNDLRHFFNIAIGSIYEAMTQIMIAYKLGYITLDEKDKFFSLAEQTIKLSNGFIKYKKDNIKEDSGLRA